MAVPGTICSDSAYSPLHDRLPDRVQKHSIYCTRSAEEPYSDGYQPGIPMDPSRCFRRKPATHSEAFQPALSRGCRRGSRAVVHPRQGWSRATPGTAMPGQRLPMRQVREVLRLKHVCGQSGHQIAAAVGVSRYTVAEYLRRAGVVGITWPVPPELDDAALERRLFLPPFTPPEALRPQPIWARVHSELRRPGVPLLLLWEEYRATEPEGYGYSRFCDLYADWRGRLSPTMRQAHPAGERLFVDYAGQTVGVIDGATGEVRQAQIFVAALGASNLTYAEARWTQSLPDWIGCHLGAFAAFGGVARQIVCDNLKVGVTRPSRYEPGISRTYQEMAAYYGTTILPARPGKPRDKILWG